ncbi:MAG: septum formation inhibitor Maf [Gammaproteobacteria bacterium]|nr:septum formation inhibitor Maf [Gammaproteobacteria bacterium]
MSKPTQLILASSSPYRKVLMKRLRLPFDVISPHIDEFPLPGEDPIGMVKRLAEKKARTVAKTNNNALIIGSDQAAIIDNIVLGKPGNHASAIHQLTQASGKKVNFLTSICVLNAENNRLQMDVVNYSVYFKNLSPETIEKYLQREQPYRCAGSFKAEGLGIALFEKQEGDDPTSLIGLPLIRLIDMLEKESIDILGTCP